ncbi:TIGR01841 family phasin [Oceanisphaera ostreae]|uniref:TIGR01841 family phasin n=1 Tax=Oceanisphaera ostreae TaxID=914151 RepID=A0ABW3KEZ5_9GAMM
MSLFDFSKLQTIQQTNLNLLQGLTSNLFAGATKLGQLQQSALTELSSTQVEYTNKLLAVRDVTEFFALQSAFFSPSALLESQLGFNREVVAVLADSQQQISQFAEQQIATGNQQLNEVIEQLAGHAPAGSESAVTALKTAVTSANEAYEQAQKAAKNATEVAESAVKQAAEQSEKAARELVQTTEKNIATATTKAAEQTQTQAKGRNATKAN